MPHEGLQQMAHKQAPMHVFVLAGQSNMAGRGGVQRMPNGSKAWDGIIPPHLLAGPHIQCWDASGKWCVAQEPLHADIDVGKICGVGPGHSLASMLWLLGGRDLRHTIGLVPCAIGATCIDEWLPHTENFQQMVQRTKAAMAALPNEATLEGLLWYQGESDADCLLKVDQYSHKLSTVLTTFRHAIEDAKLPIVQVAITCTDIEKAPYWQQINEIQRKDICKLVSRLTTVDARGLALQADGIHLTAQAQDWLGCRLAEVLRSVVLDKADSGCKYA